MSGRHRVDPLGEFEQPVASRRGLVKGFQRRRRGAQHDGNRALFGAHQRQITRRITQPVHLLERGIVLLVDDDQTRVWAAA